MNTKNIIDKALGLEGGRELLVFCPTKEERNTLLSELRQRRRQLLKETGGSLDCQIHIEKAESTDGKHGVKLSKVNTQSLCAFIKNPDGTVQQDDIKDKSYEFEDESSYIEACIRGIQGIGK